MDRALLALAVLGVVLAWALAFRALRRPRSAPATVDPGDFGLGPAHGRAVVAFSSRYCLPCQAWEAALHDTEVPWVKVDVARRPDLVRRYGVRSTPLVLAIELPGGRVTQSWSDAPAPVDLERLAG